MARGNSAEAIKSYTRAFEKKRNSAVVLKLHSAHQLYGDAARAQDVLARWLAEFPNDVSVRMVLATGLLRQGKEKLALQEYERILELQPDNALALNNVAWLYFKRGDARALEIAERAYQRRPELALIIDTYGWLLVQDGQLDQGLALLDKALEQGPGNGDIRYHRAAALAKAGRLAEALSDLQALLESDRSFAERVTAEALLKVLQPDGG